MLFTYLHLAGYPEVARELLAREVTGVAYETVQLADGSLPLLTPMSEIAGRLAPQVGAHFLERPNGGRGVLLGGVAGVAPARVVILGAGTVGSGAADLLIGAVLVPGGRAPQIVSEDLVAGMQPRSVIVDVAVDQGGCVETTRETSHDDPVYDRSRRRALRGGQHGRQYRALPRTR